MVAIDHVNISFEIIGNGEKPARSKLRGILANLVNEYTSGLINCQALGQMATTTPWERWCTWGTNGWGIDVMHAFLRT
jgi:hypothetical protein